MEAVQFYGTAIGLLSTIMTGIVGILLRFFWKDFVNLHNKLKNDPLNTRITIHQLEKELAEAKIDYAKTQQNIQGLDNLPEEEKNKILNEKKEFIAFLTNRIDQLKNKLVGKEVKHITYKEAE